MIFDEVISGFRVGFEGAAGMYNIAPDMMTFGKIMGGGMPVGAYAGKEEIMNCVSPVGNVYQAGTLSGNPVAMAAGNATLNECLKPGFYEELERKADLLKNDVNAFAKEKGYNFHIKSVGGIFWLAFSDKLKINRASDVDASSMDRFKTFYGFLLDNGVYVGPSGYEVGFISEAHTDEQIATAAGVFKQALDLVFTK